MPKLAVIIASVREGRVGEAVARWFLDVAAAHGAFDPQRIDLKELALPLLSERHHPRLGRYEQETTRTWSRVAAAADAFVIVTPEYNYGSPPALVNAFDHLYVEWHYKAVGFVSYGGLSGGTRSVQMTKQILTTLKMVPLVEAVHITYVAKQMKDGVFAAAPPHEQAAAAMLDELRRWTNALQPLRAQS